MGQNLDRNTLSGNRQLLQQNLTLAVSPHKVYYQPPANLLMDYPCVVFKLSSDQPTFANNNRYGNKNRYTLTVIDRSSESTLFDVIRKLPLITFSTHYVVENLHHYVFSLYF